MHYSCHSLAVSALAPASCKVTGIDDLFPLLDECILVQGRMGNRWLYAGLGQPERIPLKHLWNFPLSQASHPTDPCTPKSPPFPGGLFLQLNYPLNLNCPHAPFRLHLWIVSPTLISLARSAIQGTRAIHSILNVPVCSTRIKMRYLCILLQGQIALHKLHTIRFDLELRLSYQQFHARSLFIRRPDCAALHCRWRCVPT